LVALTPFPSGRYRLNQSMMVLFNENGRQVARTVPAESTITVGKEALNNCAASFVGEKLMRGKWRSKEILMFTQDLKSKTEHLGQAR
jgi:hypothetical protein